MGKKKSGSRAKKASGRRQPPGVTAADLVQAQNVAAEQSADAGTEPKSSEGCEASCGMHNSAGNRGIDGTNLMHDNFRGKADEEAEGIQRKTSEQGNIFPAGGVCGESPLVKGPQREQSGVSHSLLTATSVLLSSVDLAALHFGGGEGGDILKQEPLAAGQARSHPHNPHGICAEVFPELWRGIESVHHDLHTSSPPAQSDTALVTSEDGHKHDISAKAELWGSAVRRQRHEIHADKRQWSEGEHKAMEENKDGRPFLSRGDMWDVTINKLSTRPPPRLPPVEVVRMKAQPPHGALSDDEGLVSPSMAHPPSRSPVSEVAMEMRKKFKTVSRKSLQPLKGDDGLIQSGRSNTSPSTEQSLNTPIPVRSHHVDKSPSSDSAGEANSATLISADGPNSGRLNYAGDSRSMELNPNGDCHVRGSGGIPSDGVGQIQIDVLRGSSNVSPIGLMRRAQENMRGKIDRNMPRRFPLQSILGRSASEGEDEGEDDDAAHLNMIGDSHEPSGKAEIFTGVRHGRVKRDRVPGMRRALQRLEGGSHQESHQESSDVAPSEYGQVGRHVLQKLLGLALCDAEADDDDEDGEDLNKIVVRGKQSGGGLHGGNGWTDSRERGGTRVVLGGAGALKGEALKGYLYVSDARYRAVRHVFDDDADD